MRLVRRASFLAAAAVAFGLGVARAGPDAGPAKLPISGVVRDEQGRPIPAVWIEVEGYPRPNSGIPAWRTDAHGRLQIDDVPRGPVKLLVTTGDWSTYAKKRVVETRAGVRDLVIVLDPGPQLFLRIVGYVPGTQVGWARVTWEEPDGERSVRQVRYAPIRDDGWIRFVALPPDREFEVWADAEINRRIVRAQGLKPGESERRIEPGEVKDIAGKVGVSREFRERKTAQWQEPLREEDFTVDVYAHPDFLVAHTRVLSDGSFRVHGLPPGAYVVSAELLHGDRGDPSRWKRVEAGTTDLVIDFE